MNISNEDGFWNKIISWLKSLFFNKELELSILGLQNAGKTTLLYQFKVNETVTSLPTIGFNCESIDYKGLNFN